MEVRARETFYVAQVPMWDRTEEKCATHSSPYATLPHPASQPSRPFPRARIEEIRSIVEFPMDLPHEAFARQHAANPAAFVVQPSHRTSLPPNFFSHEVCFFAKQK